MAFIGKKINEGSKKAKVTVSINKGRVGLVFRKGIVAPGTLIDVLIGVEDDFGFLLVKRDEGTEVKKFGNSDNVVSWGASRKASVVYPALKRAEAVVVSDDENGLLLKVVMASPEEVFKQLAAAPAPAVAPAPAAVIDNFDLGLDPAPVVKAVPAKPKAVPAKKK